MAEAKRSQILYRVWWLVGLQSFFFQFQSLIYFENEIIKPFKDRKATFLARTLSRCNLPNDRELFEPSEETESLLASIGNIRELLVRTFSV